LPAVPRSRWPVFRCDTAKVVDKVAKKLMKSAKNLRKSLKQQFLEPLVFMADSGSSAYLFKRLKSAKVAELDVK
jgi:hypothetical protein